MTVQDVIDLIQRETDADKMTRLAAMAWLEELRERLARMMDALEDDILE